MVLSLSQSSPSGWAATSEPLLVAPIRAPILSPRAPLDCAAAAPEPAHLNRLTQGHATMPLAGRLGEIERILVVHEEAAAEHARGAAYRLSKQVACRAKVGFAVNELQLLSKDGTHPGTKFAARCEELFGEKFEDNEAWLSKCVAHVGGIQKFCNLLEDMGINVECGDSSIKKATNYFHTLLDAFAEKSPVASQYLASDVRVCNYDYKKTGFVEAFASCMKENFDFTTQTELVKYCKERQQAAALLMLSVKVGCTLSELDGWEANVLGHHHKKYWFRDPSGNEYRSLATAAVAAASLLSESETETESSNKRGRPDDDDDDDDAPSSKRPRRSELHSMLVRLCKVGNIPYEDQMDTATLSLLVRTRLAQNPSDGVDVANTICSLVPNGAVAVAGTLFLRALGV